MKYSKAILFFLLFGVSSCALDGRFSHNWRAPLENAIKAEWRSGDSRKYIFIEGDFNGDGNKDEANLLVRKNGLVVGLFAFISNGARFDAYLLDEFEEDGFFDEMGIRLARPGQYKTACGKGYFNCRANEVMELNLANNAIELFKYEGPSSYYFWDQHINRFHRVWVSD